MESAFEPLDDITCVGMISELLDWARLDPVLSRLADPGRTYLCGHSRVRAWPAACQADSWAAKLMLPSMQMRLPFSGLCKPGIACVQGGKLSVLAAAADTRVRAVFLADPVDNTVWAPEARGHNPAPDIRARVCLLPTESEAVA